MTTVTTVTTDAVAAVQQLRDDRDRLLGLLADVLAATTRAPSRLLHC